ncbi:uncharacterized protein LOC110891939 [Helianthus annuus]|uniref:uncharacterized protein LOC110891939 n=1 Tax=Helianthus annuus TaxID=4232 RepID=UPI001652C41B|nr:uncharacterized protein LOC110891939 [Helianthus annuus]
MTYNMVEKRYGLATSDTYVGVANKQPDNKTGKLDTAQQGYNQEAYIDVTRKYEIGSSSPRTGYVKGGHDSRSSSRYRLVAAHPSSSSCDRFGTFAMNRYAPRLDELNHTWKKNRGMQVYDHPLGTMDASRSGEHEKPSQQSSRHHNPPTNHRAAG